MTIDWKKYDPNGCYDELISTPGYARARGLTAWLRTLSDEELQGLKLDADLAILDKGVSFTVYSDGENIDRAWPFDIIPRVIPIRGWRSIEAGLKQRLQALNLFIHDLYHGQKIIRDGIVPKTLIAQSKGFRQECVGIRPAHKVWAHICGSDLVRDSDGSMYVLEDNLRVPSGVSYMIENREVTHSARKVALVGELNDWDPGRTSMKRRKDGSFSITLDLDCNREYQCKYLVDNEHWEKDREADKYLPSPVGISDNSVVVV